MTLIRTLGAALAAAGIAASAVPASAQTPYNAAQSPYGQQSQPQYGQQPTYGQTYGESQDPLTALLGALFGDRLGASTSLESEWSRGRRPLYTQRSQFRSRLDTEVRAGTITSYRADRLTTRYDELVQLEARYAADGRITAQEQGDLATRYRALTDRLEDVTDGSSNGQWVAVAAGQRAFEARLDQAVYARTIDRYEATRLRSDYQALIQLEASYQRDGLNTNERADLQNRLGELERRAGFNQNPGGGGYDNRTRLTAIEAGVARAERSNWISRAEAADIRVELGDLSRLDAAYSRYSPSREETDYLTRRIGELEARARLGSR